MPLRCQPMLVALAVAGLALSTGCGGWTTAQPVVVGPQRAMPPAMYAAALESARLQGYEPRDIEPARGSFIVPAHYVDRRGRGAQLVVQLYRDGYARVTPAGAVITPSRDGYRMPAKVRDEMLVFAMDLREALEGGAR